MHAYWKTHIVFSDNRKLNTFSFTLSLYLLFVFNAPKRRHNVYIMALTLNCNGFASNAHTETTLALKSTHLLTVICYLWYSLMLLLLFLIYEINVFQFDVLVTMFSFFNIFLFFFSFTFSLNRECVQQHLIFQSFQSIVSEWLILSEILLQF